LKSRSSRFEPPCLSRRRNQKGYFLYLHSPLMECMGSLTELLGNSPRVAIIETFAEQPELEFSVPEIVKQTGVSKRGAYLHIAKLLEEGIIAKGKKTGKCQYFRVNEHDRRGEFLGVLESVFTLGRLESSTISSPPMWSARTGLGITIPGHLSGQGSQRQNTWRFWDIWRPSSRRAQPQTRLPLCI